MGSRGNGPEEGGRRESPGGSGERERVGPSGSGRESRRMTLNDEGGPAGWSPRRPPYFTELELTGGQRPRSMIASWISMYCWAALWNFWSCSELMAL